MIAETPAGLFEPHRTHLTGLAYRMLGSVADAEDVVQDAYLRWHEADSRRVRDPRAFLSKMVARLCLDELKSARVRREQYIGPWLPEPVLDEAALATQVATEYAADLSFALLLALERLSPLERAAFLLHDVFDMRYADVAEALGRSEATCRQLAARARANVRKSRPRYRTSSFEATRLGEAFLLAASTGNADELRRLLAEDAVLYTDGGGKVRAALRPIRGGSRIAQFVLAILHYDPPPPNAWPRPATINGTPGFVLETPEGPIQTFAVDAQDGKIQRLYVVRNPDKLRRLMMHRTVTG